QLSPQAYEELQNRGLGVTPGGQRLPLNHPSLPRLLQQQGFTSTITRDPENGISTLNTSFRNLQTGLKESESGLQKHRTAITDTGQVYKALSNNVNGARNLFDQFGRVI